MQTPYATAAEPPRDEIDRSAPTAWRPPTHAEAETAPPAANQGELRRWASGAGVLQGVTAAVAWAALFAQIGMGVAYHPDRLGLVVVNFFSYFTNLANLLAAFCLTAPLLWPQHRVGRFASNPSVRGAAALYIAITGLIYTILLRGLWTPSGLRLATDVALHDVVPSAYLVWWLMVAPRGLLAWTNPLSWLAFPLVFAAWTLGHGALTGFYPYPFLNVERLGLPAVLVAMIAIGAVILILGCGLVAIDRAAPRMIGRWRGRRLAQADPSARD